MQIINLYKKVGETPKEALERLRILVPKYKSSRLTYAGRLDPMAEGVLLVLEGDYTEKDKIRILNLPKTYYFEVLWGVQSDSFDILGKLDLSHHLVFDARKLENILLDINNLKKMPYPPFSSKTVSGVPLFKLAKEGSLDKSKIPDKKINIYSLKYLGDFKISSRDLLRDVTDRISLVHGDFRQDQIINNWQSFIPNLNHVSDFIISKFRTEVSSGTYIRSISNLMGEKMGSGALCFKIIREAVGEYQIINSL